MTAGALSVSALAALLAFMSTPLHAQQPRPSAGPGGGASAAPPSAHAQQPFDPTGYWVSLITQNWQYRMVVPGRGEYADIPINMAAKRLADAWNPAADSAAGKQCEAYGAAVIMRNPERLHITWQDEDTLRVQVDEGMQTRSLHFKHDASAATMAPSLQGYSAARWLLDTTVNTFGAPARAPNAQHYGSLAVDTDHLLPGLLRKNGVPYGAQTKMSEYWDLRRLSPEDQWLTVSTKVQDPEYLFQPYVYDSIFQKEPDGSKWHPSPCTLQS